MANVLRRADLNDRTDRIVDTIDVEKHRLPSLRVTFPEHARLEDMCRIVLLNWSLLLDPVSLKDRARKAHHLEAQSRSSKECHHSDEN